MPGGPGRGQRGSPRGPRRGVEQHVAGEVEVVEPGDVGQVVRAEEGGRTPVGQQRAVPGTDQRPARSGGRRLRPCAGRGRGGRDGTARDPAGRGHVG